MGLYDPLIEPASTLSPGNVQTKSVTTEIIELNENTVNDISHEYTDTKTTTVPSSKALYEAYHILNNYITSIDPHHVLYTDNTVITLPLLPEAFDKTGWDVFFNWAIDDGKMVYVSNNITNNYIKIVPEVLTHPGYYFLVVEVDRLDSGELVVMDTIIDDPNYVVSTIDNTGIFYIEVNISNTDAHTLIFSAKDVSFGQSIRISSIGVYRVTDRIRHYLTYYLQNNDNLEAFKAEINAIVNKMGLDLVNTSLLANETSDTLEYHLKDLDAHRELLSLENLGAASYNHSHNYKDGKLIGVAPEKHTHIPAECGAASEVHVHDNYVDKNDIYDIVVETVGELNTDAAALEEHINNIGSLAAVKVGNPHGTTPDIIGAAPKVHSHDDTYIKPEDITDLINNSLESIDGSFTARFDAHIKDTNPHGITTSMINAAPATHTHNYTTRDEVATLIYELLGEQVSETVGGGGSSVPPMAIVQYSNGKYPENDIKPEFITRPITPVVFPRIIHNTNNNYDYHSGVARSNVSSVVSGYGHYKAFAANYDSACIYKSTTPTETSPILIEYEFHTRRNIIGYTIKSDCNLTTACNAYIKNYGWYIDNKLIHTQDSATYNAASKVYSYTFRLPQVLDLSSKVTYGVADPDPRFTLTTNYVKLGDYIKHTVTTIVHTYDPNNDPIRDESGNYVDQKTTATYYYKVTDTSKLTTAAGYTTITEADIPTDTNWSSKVISLRITGITTTNNSTVNLPVRIIPLFGDVKNDYSYDTKSIVDEVAIKRGMTYTYKSKRITTESSAKLDLTPYLEEKISPLYLFLQTTTKTLEGKVQNQQVNKLVADQFPYEYGYSREGLPLFTDIYSSTNTNNVFGTLTASSTSTNSAPVRTIYAGDTDTSYVVNKNTVTFTHTVPEITPKVTVKSSMKGGVLTDARFNLTTSQVQLGDYVLNEISMYVEENGVETLMETAYAMYEVIDINNLKNTDGYKQVDEYHSASVLGISSCQLLFNNSIRSSLPTNIKLVAKVKTIDNEEMDIKVGTETVTISTTTNLYTDVVLVDVNDYLPTTTSGDIWYTPPMITSASSIVQLTLTLSNAGTSVGVTKFILYLETKFYNIGTDLTMGDNNHFPLGKLTYTEVNGKPMYIHDGNILGVCTVVPLIGKGTTSDGITTYTINNHYGTEFVECKLLNYKGNNIHSDATDVVSTDITSDTITIKVATGPTLYHCLYMKRLW